MSTPILTTKLFIPPTPPNAVLRSRLIERLNDALRHKLTLISAPAGFGKTTLVSEWLAVCERSAAWLSLDEGDSDPVRFLSYLVAALQTLAANLGEGVVGALQSPQPPPIEAILTTLINDIAAIPRDFVLVLDDYHLVDAHPVDQALTFLLERLPPRLHLVLTTREDPALPLARLRVRGQLTELRAADLRFTTSEAAEFLNPRMGLRLAAADVAALEDRTEGWIAGLQLAALSLQGRPDTSRFIQSFSGSHRFVLDYLMEEVLQKQPESVQTFLLRTSILDRFCGPLCDAVALEPSVSGHETLGYLERANLFLVALDDERRWYRYHHLFADLLRQRQQQRSVSSTGDEVGEVTALHRRASQWYEDNGLEIDAFHHAAAAQDVERVERLIEGAGTPLYLRGSAAPVLSWLASLPTTVLDARPSLWVTYAAASMYGGQPDAVEAKLRAAEAVLQGAEPDDRVTDLVGQIASARATLAVIQHDVEAIVAQSRRALEYLDPDNLLSRAAATWTLGYAYQRQGERAAARRAFTEIILASTPTGPAPYTIAATLNLGQVQEVDNELTEATQTYQRVLKLAGDPPQLMTDQAHLGLGRICYQQNELDAAQWHGEHCGQQTRRGDGAYTFASSRVLLARLRLARGDLAGAAAFLAEAEKFLRQHDFASRMPEVAAAQVQTLLRQGDVAAAARLAEIHDLPLSRARVHLAQGNPAASLATLEPLRLHAEAKGWADERLKVMVLQAVALQAHGDGDQAEQRLLDALALAETGGFIRLFVDEGAPMARLLSAAATHGRMPDYLANLQSVLEAEKPSSEDTSHLPPAASTPPLIESLSHREQEILQLITRGLSNREISERLFLALSTVKGHNRIIFDKLQVQRRTEAVARGRELGLV